MQFGDGSFSELLPSLSPKREGGVQQPTEIDETRLQKEMEMRKEQEAAQMRLKERKMKLKKKQEAKKRAEEERMMREKEEEVIICCFFFQLSDIFLKVQRDPSGDTDLDKVIAKVKKKYNKKVNALKREIDDLHEEFQMEREDLLDNFREANKDAELFRQICIGLLGENKLRKVTVMQRIKKERMIF